MFPTNEDALLFLETHKFDRAQAALLERLDRPLDAALVHLRSKEIDRLKKAKELLAKSDCDQATAQRICRNILDQLWSHVAFATAVPIQRDSFVDGLIGVSEEVATTASSVGLSAEVSNLTMLTRLLLSASYRSLCSAKLAPERRQTWMHSSKSFSFIVQLLSCSALIRSSQSPPASKISQ